jgi:hypothetical protein
VWLKQHSACFLTVKPWVQILVPPKKPPQSKRMNFVLENFKNSNTLVLRSFLLEIQQNTLKDIWLKNVKPGMVVHGYNPSYLGGRDWNDHNLRQSKQRLVQPPSQQISWIWWSLPIIPSMVGWPGPKKDLMENNNLRQKQGWEPAPSHLQDRSWDAPLFSPDNQWNGTCYAFAGARVQVGMLHSNRLHFTYYTILPTWSPNSKS